MWWLWLDRIKFMKSRFTNLLPSGCFCCCIALYILKCFAYIGLGDRSFWEFLVTSRFYGESFQMLWFLPNDANSCVLLDCSSRSTVIFVAHIYHAAKAMSYLTFETMRSVNLFSSSNSLS